MMDQIEIDKSQGFQDFAVWNAKNTNTAS